MRRLFLAIGLICAFALVAAPAFADEFTLHNHKYGGARPPLYGLRLDGLFDGKSNEVFTFSFDDPGVEMRLEVIDNGGGDFDIEIRGTVYGGRIDLANDVYDVANNADQVGTWDVYFRYNELVSAAANGYTVTADDPANKGWIQRIKDSAGAAVSDDRFDLRDFDGNPNKGYSFKFLDEIHRGDGPWAGWGWVDHDWNRDGNIDPHLAASDWLFTAQAVPEPGTLGLLGLGLLGVVGVTRRRTRNA